MNQPIEIFCCAAEADQSFLKRLRVQLDQQQQQGIIKLWDESQILAGANADEEIRRHLTSARIFLLLISPDFLVNDYCYGRVMKVALERYKQGKATTIPVIVRPSDWENIPVLRDIRVLPKNGEPISNLPDQEQEHAFWKVGKEIKGTVEALGEADKDVGPDPVSDPVQKKGPLLLNPLITILIPCLKLITRRWIWAVIGVIVLLSGVLWGASSPTVPYIEIPRGSYYYFSTANNGDVYIYPVNRSTFFVARRNDFSSPIDSTKTDQTKWLSFFARPDTISVEYTLETIQGKDMSARLM